MKQVMYFVQGLCLACVAFAALQVAFSVANINAALKQMTATLVSFQRTSDAIPETLNKLTVTVDKTRYESFSQLSLIRQDLDSKLSDLVKQTGDISEYTTKLLADADGVAVQANNKTLPAATELLSNPDYAKLTRDLRQTTAITGVAMSHLRETANVIAKEAPEMAASANGIASDVHGISGDVKQVTDEIVRPRKWYEKVWSAVKVAAGLAAGHI